MAQTFSRRLKVFFAYAHADEDLRDELDTHLAMLKNSNSVETWYDRKIPPGDEWDPAIAAEIEAADLILLLISANFLHSKFCYGREMKRALERHDAGEARVIPIMVKPCDWEGAPFAKLQGLPKDMKPVITWPIKDEAWTDVAIGIRAAVTFHQTRMATGSSRAVTSTTQAASAASMSLRWAASYTFDGLRTHWLEVLADVVPEDGYIGCQTQLHYDSLVYDPKDTQEEFLWPSAAPATMLRAQSSQELVSHGALSGLLPPLPRSDFIGPLVRVTLQCPDVSAITSHRHRIHLLAYDQTANPNGACYLHERGPFVPETIGQADLPGLGHTDIAAEIDVVCNPLAE